VDGAMLSLIALSHDLYSVEHTNRLPQSMIERLRDPREFQGVRYEVAVAAIWSRLGFTLEWVSTSAGPGAVVEFIATNPITYERTAVEAKSRHRPGALGFPGAAAEDPAAITAGVQALLESARTKSPGDMPYAIFVDLNLPPEAAARIDDLATE